TYNYQSLATTEIARCRQYDINAGTYSVRPGDAWNDWGYPSYYFPGFFRVFGEFEGGAYQTTWNNVVQRCLNNINTNRNTTSGLVGEICAVDTGTRRTDDPCKGGGCNGSLYKYNSCRVPWRYAIDWVWYGNATNSSGNEVNMLASFWNGRAATDVRDGYRINDNSVEGSVNNASFVGPAGCSLMYGSTYSSRLTEYYTRTNSFDVNESYYNGSLQILTLLLMTGNFHNLRSLGTPEPTKTNTPFQSGQVIDCFEDNNGINDWGGEWYTYADQSTCMLTCTVWPAPDTGVTPSAGGPTGSTYYLRVTGTKAAATPASDCYPSIGFGTDLRYKITQTAGVVDLRPFYSAGGGIRFYARGNGTAIYKITLVPRGAGTTIHKDWAMYEYQFTPPSAWSQISIPFSDFTQPTWSTETYTKDAVLQIMQKIQIQNGTNDAMTFDFSMDCIELYPYLWTPTVTRTSTPAGTATFTRTRTPTASPTYSRTPTRTNTSAASPTFTPSRTASPTFSRTASPTYTRTATRTNTSAASLTFTPSRTMTSTYTRTISPTSSRTPTATNTSISSPTFTPSRTASPTYSRTTSPTEIITTIFTPTFTFSRTASPTFTRTPTTYLSYTPTRTSTAGATSTFTPSRTITTTYSMTPTIYLSGSPTQTRTTIPTNTFTSTRTATPSWTATITATSSFTVTDTISSNTPTATPTFTSTYSITLTFTQTWTNTSTFTFTRTNTPVNTSTFTRTATSPATNTHTPTATRTSTSTFTYTLTYTPTRTMTQTLMATATFTITMTATPEPVSEELKITDVIPYPNPFNPEKDEKLKIGLGITQLNVDKYSVTIYTSGYRMIKEIKKEIPLRQNYIEIDTKDLQSLSNGTYYYYVIITKGNKEAKSKIDKLIIMK
nr:hypothetical protein [Candidatus Goldiibacteriota bacterium]